ncbi:vacuolar protein sorting-associated protein 9 [Phytophthora pseudosyringae]|uniref:Vacuolar protein sorting-associated protein 9 n=1 Tax=Phytophthora pseudosyringae TaxID=221518 RepID=A0A8T1VM41_9STRA|nr:vacuolar protein sorting-associated protein 9 [Phytophthora pseudosyringae]
MPHVAVAAPDVQATVTDRGHSATRCASPASSSDEEVDVELLDSVSKLDSALRPEQLSPTASEESGNDMSGNQSEEREDVEQLRRANGQLRSEVADLTSALLARDLELVRLRERCQFLTTAVEQQDEVIAKIYAATTTANDANKASVVTALSVPAAGSTLGDASGGGLFGLAKGRFFSSSAKQNEISTSFSSMKSYPGAVGMADPAHQMLEARLGSMGFQGESVEKAVESLRENSPSELEKLSEDVVKVDLGQLSYTPRASANSSNHSATTSVYSSSSTATASSSSSLFGDVGEPVSKPPRSWSSPRSIPIVKRRPSLERQDSSPTEGVFARSAGFLRKSNRTMSGRLSVSDLGLLHNDDDEAVDSNQTPEAPPFSTHGRLGKNANDEEGSLDFGDSGGSTVSTRSRSQRNLFADVDEALQAKTKQKNSDTNPAGGGKEDEDSLTYGEFLQRISLPASRDILDKIRMFVGSILGPRGDGRPPRSTDYVEYDFYGKHEFRRRCNRFFENMEDILLKHPAWRYASEAKLAKARDGIEKYVMDKVSDIPFNQLKECQQWGKEDEALLRRMQLLSFITPAMLDIKPCMRNEVVWSMAEDELRRINSFRSPGDKINCIVRCCSVIFSVLNLSRGDSGSRPGADDFLPVFIYIVLHSQIPRLHSNCEYISAYRNQADLMSKAGYCFVNLRSAIEFIMVMDGSMLSISNDEFQRLYSEREKLLLKS